MRTSARNSAARAPRVSIPTRVEVAISIGRQVAVGSLIKLSLNGGVIQLARPVAPGALADLRMNTISGNVSAAIEFLDVVPGLRAARAFRFIELDAEDRRRLQRVIAQMIKEGFGDGRNSGFIGMAMRVQRFVGKARDALLVRN